MTHAFRPAGFLLLFNVPTPTITLLLLSIAGAGAAGLPVALL
jgi:hypothetical protein